nr:MAG TPA: hypothetical protein [Caudoviricetes sp.]
MGCNNLNSERLPYELQILRRPKVRILWKCFY